MTLKALMSLMSSPKDTQDKSVSGYGAVIDLLEGEL